jgi:hypothetical protein
MWVVASLFNDAIKALLDAPDHAVLSTLNPDGTVHSTVVWQDRSPFRVPGEQCISYRLAPEQARHQKG